MKSPQKIKVRRKGKTVEIPISVHRYNKRKKQARQNALKLSKTPAIGK